MDNEALKTILANAIAAAGKMIDTECSHAVIVPDGYHIENLELMHDYRDRFAGHFFTRSLHDFASYLEHHWQDAEPTPPIFIDPANMSATVFFDLGTLAEAGHCVDSATLSLIATAAYTKLCSLLDNNLTQLQLLDWLEDWAPNLLAYSGDDTMTMGAAIAALRKIKLSELRISEAVIKPLYSSQSTLDEVEASTADTMPTDFVLLASPYEGLPVEEIKVSLVYANTGGLHFKLKWRGMESQREEIAKGFRSSLSDALNNKFPLLIGSFRKS